MTNSDIPTKTSSLYNVQPTSHTSKHRIFPHYHTLQNISKLITSSFFSSRTLPIPSTLHLVIFYLNTKHGMQHIKIMLVKLQLPFESD